MASLVLTITETLRYRGKLGQWSWALHRVAGLGTLLFLMLHVVDTSWAIFYPELYTQAIRLYQSPLFTVGEFALVACVVYHALNGFRIVIFDWRPKWWRYQANAARLVLLGTVVILVPTFILMFGHVAQHYQEPGVVFDLRLNDVIAGQVPFAVGTVIILALSLVAAVVVGFIPGIQPKKKVYKRSRFDTFMWQFMRVSGVIIIPLVFGHLAMMHVIQGVFEITAVNHVPIGATGDLINVTGLASDFVSSRWHTMFAGVFIWRLYDIGMLFLVVIHGFNGLRYVVNDYVHNPLINRTLRIAILSLVVGYLVLGGAAIIDGVPKTTAQIVNQMANTGIKP